MMSYYTPYSALQDLLRHYNANKNETDKLPMIPYHGLRHTSATLLIAAHQDVRTVSNRLGHAQASPHDHTSRKPARKQKEKASHLTM